MANNEKKQFKTDFLEALVNLYKEIGEPVPYGIVSEIKYSRKIVNTGLTDLVDTKKIVILYNPYNTNEDFIGLHGKTYPKSIEQLTEFRKNVDTMGVIEARKLLLVE